METPPSADIQPDRCEKTRPQSDGRAQRRGWKRRIGAQIASFGLAEGRLYLIYIETLAAPSRVGVNIEQVFRTHLLARPLVSCSAQVIVARISDWPAKIRVRVRNQSSSGCQCLLAGRPASPLLAWPAAADQPRAPTSAPLPAQNQDGGNQLGCQSLLKNREAEKEREREN